MECLTTRQWKSLQVCNCSQVKEWNRFTYIPLLYIHCPANIWGLDLSDFQMFQNLFWMIFVRSQLPYQLCPGRWRFFLPPFFIHISQTIRPILFFHRDCEQNFSVSFFFKYYLAKDHIGFKVNTLVKELIVDRMIFFLWTQTRNRCTPN